MKRNYTPALGLLVPYPELDWESTVAICLYPEAEEQVSMMTMTLVFPVHTSASCRLMQF